MNNSITISHLYTHMDNASKLYLIGSSLVIGAFAVFSFFVFNLAK